MSTRERIHAECLSDQTDIIEHLRRELFKCRNELESRESELADTHMLNSAQIEQIKTEFGERESSLEIELARLKEENSFLGKH